MRLRRLALPVAALITGLVSASVASAATTTTVESGWWNEAAVGPLAVPTVTPSDQLQVSNGLAGPLAFAAVRITPATGTPDTDTVTLKLTIPGSTVGTPTVAACVTTSAWKPGADQEAKAAPGYTCGRGLQVVGTATSTSESWTVPLSWASNGVLSLALVPTPGTTTPFSVTYDQPNPADVVLAAAAPPSPVSTVGAPTPDTTPPAPVDNTVPAYTSAPAPGPGSGQPSAPAVSPALAVTPSQAPSPPTTVATSTPTPVAAPASAAPGGGAILPPAPSKVPRLVAFILLIFVAVALFGLAGQPDRAPRLLGPLGDRIVVRRRPPVAAGAAAGSTAGGMSAGGISAGSTAGGVAPAAVAPAPAPMGGGARIRAHRAARLALARGAEPAPSGAVAAAGSGGTYGEQSVIAPVRGIGRFAKPRYGPPRRI